MRPFCVLFFAGFFLLPGCRIKQPHAKSYGGAFRAAIATENTTGADNNIDPIRHSEILDSANSEALAFTTTAVRKEPFIGHFHKEKTFIPRQPPENTNKNVWWGTRFTLGGLALGAISMGAAFILLVDWLVALAVTLFIIAIGLFFYGIIRGYIGWRQLRKNNFTEDGKTAGKWMRFAFWFTFLAMLLGILAGIIIPILYYK
jgi:hypothetical protein